MSNIKHENESPSKDKTLHIFVNRRKFGVGDGVKSIMTGAEIASLVSVPASNAVVRWDSGPQKGEEIPVNASIEVRTGMHFLVTRKVVEGGHGSSTH